MSPSRAALLAVVALLVSGCQFPRDTRGTLERVQGGVLRVGVTEAEPWVTTGDGRPEGVEISLIDGFARELDAEVDFRTGSEEELIGALHEGSLDLVAGGMTKQSPWKKQASPTRPFAVTRLVLGVAAGADGEPGVVAVERGTEAAGLAVRKLDSRVEEVDRLAPGRPAVVDARLRLREAGHVFTGEALVVAVDDQSLPERLKSAEARLRDLDWKMHDVVVSAVPSLAEESQEHDADTATGG